MPWHVILPLVLATLVLFVVLFFLQRARQVLLEARRAAGFRGRVEDLARRLDGELDDLLRRVDALRRGQADAGEAQRDLEGGRARLASLAEEARAVPAPADVRGAHERLVEEVERAGRALDMVVHGCATAAAGVPRTGDLEARTSIKRGYLNLVHAREAAAEQCAVLVESTKRVRRRWRLSRI